MIHTKEDFESTFNVSRETLDMLAEYESLLRKWTAKINLVSRSTLDDIWARHFIDSAQVFNWIDPQVQEVADFGSGGGFPGLVIAILNSEHCPERRTTLIESDVRKASFLSTVIRDLGLNAKALPERVENVPPLDIGCVTARALAPLETLFPFATRHLSQNGTCLFLKGARYKEEVDAARNTWDFDLKTQESMTRSDAALLQITNLRLKH